VTELRGRKRLFRNSAKRLGELAAIVASSEDVIISKESQWNHHQLEQLRHASVRLQRRGDDWNFDPQAYSEHLHSDEKTILESIRAGRPIEHFETVRLTKDGRLIDVSLTVSPVKDATGQIIGASKILRDISSRKPSGAVPAAGGEDCGHRP